MNNREKRILVEQYYRFVGIPSQKKQLRIMNLLSYCKEVRDTAYPMTDSLVTELEIVEFIARKEKDIIYINGSLSLVDGDRSENRCFEAYVLEDKEDGKTRVYMDITRLCVEDEPKMIRTTDAIIEDEHNIISVTAYASNDGTEAKTFSSEFPKNPGDDYIYQKKCEQIRAL